MDKVIWKTTRDWRNPKNVINLSPSNLNLVNLQISKDFPF